MPACYNCNRPVEGNFCSNCGQSMQVKRLSFKNLFHDVQNKLFGIDNKYFRTIVDLFVHPGVVFRSYISGNRVKYTGGAGFFFICITILVLHMSFFGIDFAAFIDATGANALGDEVYQKNDFSIWMQRKISQNFRIFNFLQIPIMAFSSLLFFKKQRLTFLEFMTFSFYYSGLIALVSFLDVSIYHFFGLFLGVEWMKIAFSALLAGWFAYSCFDEKRKWWTFTKGVLVSMLSTFFFMMAVMLAIVVYLITNPELVKTLKP